MEIRVVRDMEAATEVSTPGEMTINGTHEAWTLELPIKDGLPGSAIPPGVFQVLLTHSPKFSPDRQFQRLCEDIGCEPLMPEIIGIPLRSEIRIHWLNTVDETKGCIGVGQVKSENFIGLSRIAFEIFYRQLVAARKSGEAIRLEVVGGLPSSLPPSNPSPQAS